MTELILFSVEWRQSWIYDNCVTCESMPIWHTTEMTSIYRKQTNLNTIKNITGSDPIYHRVTI